MSAILSCVWFVPICLCLFYKPEEEDEPDDEFVC